MRVEDFVENNSITFFKMFLGDCLGVIVIERKKNPFLMFQLLVHDDGGWYIKDGCVNTHWLPELIEQLCDAYEWLNENAEKTNFGWKNK